MLYSCLLSVEDNNNNNLIVDTKSFPVSIKYNILYKLDFEQFVIY